MRPLAVKLLQVASNREVLWQSVRRAGPQPHLPVSGQQVIMSRFESGKFSFRQNLRYHLVHVCKISKALALPYMPFRSSSSSKENF